MLGTALLTSTTVLAGTLMVGGPVGAGASPVASHLSTAWTEVPAATPTGFKSGYFSNVTCVTATDCWSAGQAVTSTTDKSFVEHYDGSRWRASALPSGFLAGGVSCPGAHDCWLAGGTSYAGASKMLIAHYNGESWSVANPSGRSGMLSDVECRGPKWCMAVGWNTNATTHSTKAIAERWDGSSWSVVSAPSTTGFGTDLLELSCVTEGDCLAAGQSWGSTGGSPVISERWSGGKWTLVVVPQPKVATTGPVWVGPNEVSCTSGGVCLLGGEYGRATSSPSPVSPLLERWTGSKWVLVTLSSTVKSHLHAIFDLSCITSTSCRAVGAGVASNSGDLAAAAHWNGSSLTMDAVVRPGLNSDLFAVRCVVDASCVSLGTSKSSSGVTTVLGEQIVDH